MFSNPMTERLVRVLPPYAIVFGVTSEYCVRHAALGLRRAGVKTVVIEDAVAALHEESGRQAQKDMKLAGVDFIPLATLISVLTNG